MYNRVRSGPGSVWVFIKTRIEFEAFFFNPNPTLFFIGPVPADRAKIAIPSRPCSFLL